MTCRSLRRAGRSRGTEKRTVVCFEATGEEVPDEDKETIVEVTRRNSTRSLSSPRATSRSTSSSRNRDRPVLLIRSYYLRPGGKVVTRRARKVIASTGRHAELRVRNSH